MPRYIDADYLDKLITQLIYEGRNITRNEYKMIDSILLDFPSADVVERKRGKWTERKVIEDGKAIEEWQSARCSVCGKYHTTPYMYYFDDFAYCPNCGAEMCERRTDDAEIH